MLINRIRVFHFFKFLKNLYNKFRIKEKNARRTILSNNCLGGILSHNLGLQFCSPFVNLWIPAGNYVELLESINDIQNYSLTNITPVGASYPIGLLNEKWPIHFQHYKNFDEAKSKWNIRLNRIDFSSLYVILVETSSCTYENLVAFDKLSFKNKIALVHKPYPEIKCAFHIKGYDGEGKNGELFRPSNLFGTYIYDQIDWIHFLELN